MGEMIRDDDAVCTGMDVPCGHRQPTSYPNAYWGPEDVAFWTGTDRYQPWKDVAVFFRVKDTADD
jgi:hypothetical protein